tara:strand:- start:2375 stop:2635 length:261 start_codon:yes stop_codon:yes gene_type:complete
MDLQFKNFLESHRNVMKEYENKKFKEWLLSNNDRGIPNFVKINSIYDALFDKVKSSNYKFINENEFKNELATYIYRLSQKQCPNEI